ncbi:hypothetical protein F5Y08DRAFT_277632 [Xylaria arbuscula]|nr:hypothetical protein F5Y08DRAFT_277632 [Xylaria arbuscula]
MLLVSSNCFRRHFLAMSARRRPETTHQLQSFFRMSCASGLGIGIWAAFCLAAVCTTLLRLYAELRPAELPMSLDFDEWMKTLTFINPAIARPGIPRAESHWILIQPISYRLCLWHFRDKVLTSPILRLFLKTLNPPSSQKLIVPHHGAVRSRFSSMSERESCHRHNELSQEATGIKLLDYSDSSPTAHYPAITASRITRERNRLRILQYRRNGNRMRYCH